MPMKGNGETPQFKVRETHGRPLHRASTQLTPVLQEMMISGREMRVLEKIRDYDEIKRKTISVYARNEQSRI
jgi:hypothetical protein